VKGEVWLPEGFIGVHRCASVAIPVLSAGMEPSRKDPGRLHRRLYLYLFHPCKFSFLTGIRGMKSKKQKPISATDGH
jgi:hypothetical protein